MSKEGPRGPEEKLGTAFPTTCNMVPCKAKHKSTKMNSENSLCKHEALFSHQVFMYLILEIPLNFSKSLLEGK